MSRVVSENTNQQFFWSMVLEVTVTKIKEFDPKQSDGALIEIGFGNSVKLSDETILIRDSYKITAYENHPLLVRDFIDFMKCLDNIRVKFLDPTKSEKTAEWRQD
jgi:hypothetical protein